MIKYNIEKSNDILEEHNQKIKIISISTKLLKLSNGVIIKDSHEIYNFKNRIRNNTNHLDYFDIIYGDDIEKSNDILKKIKSDNSKVGGRKTKELGKGIHSKKFRNEVKVPWNKGMKNQYTTVPCSEERKKKISFANKGEKNGMYGIKHSDDYKKNHSIMMKNKILNGEFTPNSNNRNTHWGSSFNGKKYRSSWEAMYKYWEPESQYEKIRIPYIFNGIEHIYIVDFINDANSELIEVKPNRLCRSDKMLSKIKSAERWCQIHGYDFVIADENYFKNVGPPKDLTGFDDKTILKIEKFYETC